MISFKLLTFDTLDTLAEELSLAAGCPDGDIREILESFAPLAEDDIEVGVCVYDGCALVRICDMGRYSFVYPIMTVSGADSIAAVDAIRAYAVKEEIPLVLTDVPREELGEILPLFRHMKLDAEDPFGEAYRLEVESECALMDPDTEILGERLRLEPLCEGDIPKMAALGRDAETNKYWGYDYLADVGEVDDGYFYQNAVLERARGSAVTMALRYDGSFIGEAVLWGFDFKGGASVAVRLMGEYRGRGFGTEAMGLVVELGETIGLVTLYAEVDERNVPSLAMTDKYFDRIDRRGGKIFYRREI